MKPAEFEFLTLFKKNRMTQQEFLSNRDLYLNGNVFQKSKASVTLYNYVIHICKRLSLKNSFKAETSEIEDIYAETAQAVLFNIHRFQDEFNHSAWIGKILKNKYLDLLRLKKRRGGYAVISMDVGREDEDGNERMFDVQDEYYCHADRMHNHYLIQEINITAQECLNTRQLEIWKLKWEDGLSNLEVMHRLKKDKSYIAVNWMRMKEQVLRTLERKGKLEELMWLKNPSRLAA
jgi:DNA-directed RNA polymerase specialized sigma24 family protein